MTEKVVQLKAGRRASDQMPEPGLWFPPLDSRITRIERIVLRLEMQVWIVLCVVCALAIFEVLKRFGA